MCKLQTHQNRNKLRTHIFENYCEQTVCMGEVPKSKNLSSTLSESIFEKIYLHQGFGMENLCLH